MKIKKYVIATMIVFSFLSFGLKNIDIKAFDGSKATVEKVEEHFESLYGKYGNEFSHDGDWLSSSRGNKDIQDLNFVRWLLKNGHASEVIKEEYGSKNSPNYKSLRATGDYLVETGKFSSTNTVSEEYRFSQFTNGNVNVGQLTPIQFNPAIYEKIKKEAELKNPVTGKVEDNRVSLVIHYPSKQTNNVKRNSGQDINMAENLYGFDNEQTIFRQHLMGYLTDEDNIFVKEEAGHRGTLLARHDSGASYNSSVHANIMNFTNGPVPDFANYTGYKQYKEKWYHFTNGQKDLGGTFTDGHGYFYDGDGFQLKNIVYTLYGKKYIFDQNGKMGTNGTWGNGKWFYSNSNGEIQTGGKGINYKGYYLNTGNGQMHTGGNGLDNKGYFLDERNGDMKTGGFKTGGRGYGSYNDGSLYGKLGGEKYKGHGMYSNGYGGYSTNEGTYGRYFNGDGYLH